MIPDSLKDLLETSKALGPLPEDAPAVFARIRRLNIKDWNEAQTRAEVIDPIIRLLGYDVETDFKAERERTVEVVGAHKAVDYSMTAFSIDHWLIEAKRPDGAAAFSREAVYQALRYAAHPDINAALMVLCDGDKIEVYDREESLKGPVLSIVRADLEARFDELRRLLSPWQQFFFERRRILRLIDRSFDNETHLGRLEEMVGAIKRRLYDKRQTVLDNWRERGSFDTDWEAQAAVYAAAPAEALIGVAFWFIHCEAHERAIRDALLNHCRAKPIDVLYRAFPPRPAAANGAFWVHALYLALGLDEAGISTSALPHEFGDNSDSLVRTMIVKTLGGLADDRPRRVIALHAAASRRLAKLYMLTDGPTRIRGEALHLHQRVMGEELSFSQTVSSPTRHLLLDLDGQEMSANSAFVDQHTDERGNFQCASAEQSVREIWTKELRILQSLPNYRELLHERGGGETHHTEAIGISFDWMAHGALVFLEQSPKWKAWTLSNHADLVEDAARMGSWQAQRWIGWDDHRRETPTRGWFEDRFAVGDPTLFWSLRNAYGYPLP